MVPSMKFFSPLLIRVFCGFFSIFFFEGRHGLDWIVHVVGLSTTCAISVCEFEPRSWRSVLNTTLCDQVCQWLATGWWFSPGTPVSFTNKTDRLNIAEILLKVALNTIALTPDPYNQQKGEMVYVYPKGETFPSMKSFSLGLVKIIGNRC